MIVFIKGLIAKYKHAAQLKACRRFGHFLNKNGEGREHEMRNGVPVPVAPVSAWVMTCKCGYGEIANVNTEPYHVTFEDGQKKLEEARRGK